MPSAETIAMPPDTALVSAIRDGDQSAMATLYDRYSSIVYSVALRVLADTGAAEDVLQEVFMQLWRNPTGIRCKPRKSRRVAGGDYAQPVH